jgi:uncharacterized damage-inducible protein DinB
MIDKDYLLKVVKKETATTLKVMRAFPEDKITFKPHERSNSARDIMRTCLFGMYLIESYVLGEKIDRSVFQTYAPDKASVVIADFEKSIERVVAGLEKLSESDMRRSFEFVGRNVPTYEWLLLMLFDQIHHRGQLTVYIRMAGGKVPSVYGPSADDPSTNL